MKNPSVTVALIIGVSLIVASSILASAIKDFGRSVDTAARNQRNPVQIPSRFDVIMETGSSPLRVDVTTKP